MSIYSIYAGVETVFLRRRMTGSQFVVLKMAEGKLVSFVFLKMVRSKLVFV